MINSHFSHVEKGTRIKGEATGPLICNTDNLEDHGGEYGSFGSTTLCREGFMMRVGGGPQDVRCLESYCLYVKSRNSDGR